jgi:hypothetical protein
MRSSSKGYLQLLVWFAFGAGCATQNEPDSPPENRGRAGSASASPASAGKSSLAQAGTAQATGGAGSSTGGSAAGNGVATAGAAGQLAAGGVTSHGGSASSGSSAGGNAAAGNAAAGAGGALPTCPTPPAATGATPLIDDFNHLGRSIPTNEGRSGVWDVWTLTPSADMSPKSANYETTGADTGEGYTHWTGKSIGGTDDWGPTLTVQLNGGCPYDASIYSGLSFKLKGIASKQSGGSTLPVPLKVMLWQPQGVPAKDAKGGTCTAAACYNHFNTFVTVPPGWDTPVSVPFASLTQGTWTGTLPFAWNAKQLVAIQFQVEVDGSKSELATFDLGIDDLKFVK